MAYLPAIKIQKVIHIIPKAYLKSPVAQKISRHKRNEAKLDN